LVIGDQKISLVWRSHYVVASLDALDNSIAKQLEDMGFSIFVFGRDRAKWSEMMTQLLSAVGGNKV
jgi:hypothetical protein